MKLRQSLVKPVTWQKTLVIFSGGTTEQHIIIIITCCSVVPPEIVMHDAYIGGCSENNIWRAGWIRLEYVDIHSVY